MKRLIVPLVSILASCSGNAPSAPANLREYLDRVASQCHVPTSIFKLRGEKEVRFQPSPDAKYEDVDCALAGLKKSPFPIDLGFVGNEYIEENKN